MLGCETKMTACAKGIHGKKDGRKKIGGLCRPSRFIIFDSLPYPNHGLLEWHGADTIMDRTIMTGDTSRKVVFSTRELTKIYLMGDTEIHALRGVDLDLYAGEFAVMLGASGSGKSTLLNILGGLDSASGGEARYGDRDLVRADEQVLTNYRRHHVGFVFQSYNLISSLTARENVAIVTEISRDPMTPEEALELVGLSERLDHFPSQLSGGEQQRVAIARAIAKRPAVLLCDEPTGALDSKTGVRVLEVLARVNRELGTTTVVITHNAVIGEMADRIIHLSDGRVSEVIENTERRSPSELRW